MSTRHVDELVQAMGLSGISKSTVSKLCKDIDERVNAFLDRPLTGDWRYLWLDATYLRQREGGRIVSVAAIIAVAVDGEGRREIVGLYIGPSEAETFWSTFLKGLVKRGLQGVKLVISDAHEGLIPTAIARDSRPSLLSAEMIPWRGGICVMPSAVDLRTDFSAAALRHLATTTKNASQSRRLLSLAAVLDGMNRTDAARIGGMDRQTLRDWVHRFNAGGPDGLTDRWAKGHPPRLSVEQQRELARLVDAGPDRPVDGVVRWRRVDLQRVIRERFGIAYHERTIGKLLTTLGFSHISARPRHPAQDDATITAFKRTSPPP